MSEAKEVNLVDHGFMDTRIKAIDIAAFLDRVHRAGQQDDYRKWPQRGVQPPESLAGSVAALSQPAHGL